MRAARSLWAHGGLFLGEILLYNLKDGEEGADEESAGKRVGAEPCAVARVQDAQGPGVSRDQDKSGQQGQARRWD